ncbi:MAG: hypothetical protein U0984_05635 [Prosthecobacter sp.]|nr:hypothetical protein [Prosthecobacter sp.]
MKLTFLPITALLCLAALCLRAEELPTLMTTRGNLLVDQPLNGPIPPFDGKSVGFASGFNGWRWNAVPRGGRWEIADGVFTGRETAEVKHPATASYGFPFKNVVIQCEVRLNNVPLDGRKYRFLMVRTTDAKDYVCSIHLSEAGMRITKDDNDHAGPDKSVPLGQLKTPLKLDTWQQVVFEILGDEMVGTVNGQSLTGRHPLITSDKHSVMFVMGVEGSVRNLKVWEALPKEGWEKVRAGMAAAK